MLKKLFGKERKSNNTKNSQESMIRSYDVHGQEYLIPKSEYQQRVLPEQFRNADGNPDALYNVIIMALQDGFLEECMIPAKKLKQIDPNHERATTILGIVLMKNGQLDAAYTVLKDYLEKIGPSGVVLTNLAKVLAEMGQEEQSHAMLWEALTIDPNQDNALDWWGAIFHEKDGSQGFLAAMEKVARIRGSWRPQLWIAREYLEKGNLQGTLNLYRQVLALASDNGDALMMISGDLGKYGYSSEALRLVAPVYQPQIHGAFAGFNLVQACLEVKEKKLGLKLCNEIEKLERYDLKRHLDQLRIELQKL